MSQFRTDTIFAYLKEEIFPESLDAKQRYYLRKKAEYYKLEIGHLYIRKFIKHDTEISEKLLMVIQDEKDKNKIMQMSHNTCTDIETGSHGGINRTRSRITEKYWWPKLSNDVAEFVGSCKQCQKPTPPPHTMTLLKRYQMGAKKVDKPTRTMVKKSVPKNGWTKICVDLCNMPTTEEGYCCMIVAIDFFSKWIDAKPMRSHTPVEAAQKFSEICYTWGFPKVVVTIQSLEFAKLLANELLKLSNVRLDITSDPKENELVKKANSSIISALTKTLGGDNFKWNNALPRVLYDLRTNQRGRCTKFTPWMIMFKCQPHLPPIESNGAKIKVEYSGNQC